MIYSAVTVFD